MGHNGPGVGHSSVKGKIVWVSLIILWILCCRLGQIITSAVLSGLVHYQVVGLNIGSGSKSCWW